MRYAISNTIVLHCDERTYMEALLEVAASEGAKQQQSRDVFVVMADQAWSDGVDDGSEPVFTPEGTA